MRSGIAVVAALFVLTVLGCSSISVSNQWRDPSWQGPPATNIVVLGVARSESTRRVFEDTFAQQLQAAGLTASSAYSQIPPGENKVKLSDFVRTSGANAVLVTRITKVEQKVNVSSAPTPVYGGFYGWYGSAWASTPMVTQYDVVTLETDVWDPNSDKLVWAVSSHGISSRDIPNVTRDLAQALIPRMKADGIIR
jgi:hypothetical protein